MAATGIAGCSGTQYRPRAWWSEGQGYEEQRLGIRTFEVWAGAGWPVERPRLEKYALYRASEITVAHGFVYFALLAGSDTVADVALWAPNAEPEPPIERDPTSETTLRHWVTHQNRVVVAHLKIRLLDTSDITRYETVVDARKVIDRLHRFINAQRPFGARP